MSLALTEEHELLRRTAAEFVASKSSLKRIRALRDAADPLGFSVDLWGEMAALGWAGIVIPESHGGSGLGYSHLAVVMEELGRGLMPEPMIPTVLATGAILAGGSDEQKRTMLPSIAKGETLAALGYQEARSRFDPHHVETRASKRDGQWTIDGEKRLVFGGRSADVILISARTSGDTADRRGITLFAIDPKAKGVTITAQSLVDARPAAIVRLEGVTVDRSGAVGEIDGCCAILDAAIDRATLALCAEMLGSMLAAFDATLDYLKTRKQFGVLIGTFQALKHRAAVVFTETELSRSAVMAAASAIDAARSNAAELVSAAKARLSDAFVLAANEAIQMHGGIGMTDEHDIGFYLKRARAAEMTFGDATWHRRRYAGLQGY